MTLNGATQDVTPEDADSALALVVANTRMAERPGVKRPHSLTQIAAAIRAAENGYGSLKEVANRVGITVEMLRRFLSVERLHPKVRALAANRRVDSLNSVHYMAVLPKADQPAVADAVITGKWSGTDVRALAPLRNRNPKASIVKLMARLARSRNQTVYAIVFPLARTRDIPYVRNAFQRASSGGLLSVSSTGGPHYKAVLTRQGLSRLRAAARQEGKSLRQYVKGLLAEMHHVAT